MGKMRIEHGPVASGSASMKAVTLTRFSLGEQGSREDSRRERGMVRAGTLCRAATVC